MLSLANERRGVSAPGMMQRSGLRARVATVAAGAPVVLLALWLGGLVWDAVVAVLLVGAVVEFGRLHGLRRFARLVLASGALAIAAAISWGPPPLARGVLGLAAAVVLGAGIAPWAAGRLGGWTAQPWAMAALGIPYLGLPFGVLARWRIASVFAPVAWFFAVVWVNDIAAFFVGLGVGRHKLAPHTSPGKSWEGAAAGVAAAAAVGAGGGVLFGLSAGRGLLLGAMIAVIAQIGDLFESAMKRRAGVKDSGAWLPGHGGVLDRFDGVFFAAPVAYAMLKLWGP